MIYRSDHQDGRRGFIKKLAEIKQEMYVNHDLELSRIYGVLLVRLTTQRLSPLCGFYHCHKRFTASAAFYEVGKNHVRNVIIASNFDYRGCKVIMVMTLLMQIQPPPVLFEVIIALAVKVDDNTTGSQITACMCYRLLVNAAHLSNGPCRFQLFCSALAECCVL